MMDLFFNLWKTGHLLLFCWSVLCFLLGILSSALIYHYYIREVMRRADKLLKELRRHRNPLPLRKDD